MKRWAAMIAMATMGIAGCFPEALSKDLHERAYTADLVVVATGALIMLLPCRDAPDSDLDCHLVDELIGGELVALGGIGAGLNTLVRDWDAPENDAPAPAVAPKPSDAPPGLTPSNLQVPAHDGPIEDLATRAVLDARAGRCVEARTSLRSIFREDPTYYQELVASEPALVACVR
ncbi:MAG TPA: hypothetical protein VL463_15095 [Kofleriaceae bacterium]|nr:hypothetical protein [Kofleriaceae bacterium]